MFIKTREIDNKLHNKAVELGLIHIGSFKYETPSNWHFGLKGVEVDLSATGSEKEQIMKSVAIQASQKAKLSEDYLLLLIRIHNILTTDYSKENKKEIEIEKWIVDFEIQTRFL